MTAASWHEALAAIERDVTAAERALSVPPDDARAGTSSWTAPTGLGPMPPSCVPQARRLLARTRRLQTVLGSRRDDLGAQLHDLRNRRDVVAAYALTDRVS